METIIYQIEFKDGRRFKIFCANRTQKDRVKNTFNDLKRKGTVKEVITITNGIHTAREWYKLTKIL